jgi:DNA-binding transcriptional LysR family regulator
MADLNDIAVFVRVAQFESFSRAAQALGMPVSTVSRKVTALEEGLGVTLLRRTTRKLNLTAQGRAYYNQCSEPLSHLFDAERVLSPRPRRSQKVSFGSPRRSSLARRPSMHSCPHF